MTAANTVARSIKLAGINLGGGKYVSLGQKNQRQIKSNLVEKQEEIDNRK